MGRTWRTRIWVLLFVAAIALPEAIDARQWRALSFGPPTRSTTTRIGGNSIITGGLPLVQLIALAHQVEPDRVIGPDLLQDRYAVEAVADTTDVDQFRALLRKAITDHFKLSFRREKRTTDVYVLRRGAGRSPLRAVKEAKGDVHVKPGRISGTTSLRSLARGLERQVKAPVVDETRARDMYAFDLSWEPGDVASLTSALNAQLGLELRSEQRGIEWLVVDRLETPKPNPPDVWANVSWLSPPWQWSALVGQFLHAVSDWLSLPESLFRMSNMTRP